MSESDEEIKSNIEKRVIEHVIKFEGKDGDSTKSEGKQLLEDMAFQMWDKEKDSLIEQFPDLESEIENINSPNELDAMSKLLHKVESKKQTPVGKVRAQAPQGSDHTFDSVQQEIDSMRARIKIVTVYKSCQYLPQ